MAKVSSDIIESYVSEVKELLESARKDIMTLKNSQSDSDALSSLLRSLHTIKGNSRMLGFPTVEKLSHSVEDIYKSVKDGKIKNTDRLVKLVYAVADKIEECVASIVKKGTDEKDIESYLQYCDKIAAGELIDIDSFINEIKREKGENLEEDDEDEFNEPVSEIQSIRIKLSRVNDIITAFDTMITREFHLKHQLDELQKFEEATGNHDLAKIRKQFESDIYALETSIFSVQEQVFDLRMLPISIVLKPLENTIALESMNLGKDVKCDIPSTDIAIDKVILEELGDILMHLVRNALDHGIESPEDRKKAGKDKQGTITISCVRETKHIELKISDDGRGLDYEKIREKATKVYPERTEEIKNMSDRELSQFLFQSGFSTKDKVTELSGRGVGLDVVWATVEKIKGRIKIESTAGKGTSFILHFPLSLSTLQGLFVYSNEEKYLIPSQHIVDIIYRKKNEYITLQNQSYIRLEGQLIPCFSLSSLFDEQKGNKNQDADSILIAEYMEQRIGIVVEQVQQFVSLVVKPLPDAFKNFSILQGIVFDEHYDIVPILHVPDILKKFKSLRGYDIKKYEAASKKRVQHILIVDDSDTTRQIERSILEGAGFAVDAAVDGIDGLEKAKAKQYDLVMSDKDMPRMTGLVLLDNLRRLEQYKEVPVVIVSADQSPDVLAEFERLGANAIIAKSDFERSKLISTIKSLIKD
ncbi:hybrid sensor histidine kinase/response regulator [Treponema ruminis]|uniref:histidine kinase n=1 Tax=Treponema ruminis TaxID=744515 RepID=A0A7W8LMA0_9SPIR|nr:response regulator [Treponema ruminis]MBB5226262.1 two-component system chemotaxis sensor kinase CheA [Treponema ruminis]QSI02831.1 hybrid sensor histidine kinase/response regulator [Treponema ruminis]